MIDVSVPCGACGKPVRGGDEFCEACGAKVTDALKAALRERLEASHSGYAAHNNQLRIARTTILLLAALFVVGGGIYFLLAQSGASDEDRRAWQVLGLNLFLAAVMFGLWIWAKRALLPALITALGIYVAVVIANALYNPLTLVQGVIMKVIVVVALAKGIQSTLAARRLETAR